MECNYDYSALIFCDFCGVFENTEAALNASDTAIETAQALIRRILLSGNSAIFLWQDSRDENSGVKEVADSDQYGELARRLALLPAQPFDGEFTELLDEFADEIRLERAVYIITACVDNDLVEKLRETGLIYRSNVILTVISSPLNRSSLTEYLKTQTKITVHTIESDSGEDIESFNESIIVQ
jgi:hypothetical protein